LPTRESHLNVLGFTAGPFPVRWETVPVSAFARHERTWRTLLAAGWAPPVLTFEFVSALLHAFARGDEVVAVGYAHERPVAMGVLVRQSRTAWSTFQPSQAPVGVWLHHPSAGVAPLLRSLLRALPGPALVVGLTQQDPQRAPRPPASSSLSTLDYIETASVIVNRPFEAYWQERDKKVRYELKRRLARLAEQGLEPRLERIDDPARVPALIAAFGELESAGWKAAGGTAVHGANAQGAFYRDLLTSLCRQGCGRIYRYAAGERVLAMQLCMEHEGALAFLKTTYDERLRACSPGVLLKAEIFRDLFDDGRIRRVEFYGSVKEWQRKWIDVLRTQYHVNVYRSALLAAAHRCAGRVRGAKRSLAPQPKPVAAAGD
jgi:CelD/BcsL family acetyltransferase involved in cellulose biosynthesis